MRIVSWAAEARSSAQPRRRALVLAGLVTFVAGIQLGHFLTWSPEAIAASGLFRDDAYFFSVLARNFHDLGVLTLDGTMETNGVQPLWMAVQVGLVAAFPSVHEATLLAWSSWACFLVFAFLATRYVAGLWPSQAALGVTAFAATVVLNARFQRAVVQGLETPLLLIFLFLSLLLLRRVGRKLQSGAAPSIPDVAGLALTSVLCFFARTDFFWLAVVVGGWLLLTARAGVRRVAVFGTLVAGAIIPYLIWNVRFHGGIVPISGRVKKFYLALHHPTFSSYLDSDEWWGLPHALTDSFLPSAVGVAPRLPIAVAMVIGALLILRWLRRSNRLPIELALLTVTVGIHALFMYAYHRELRISTFYYFIPQVVWFWLVVTLFLGAMADRASDRRLTQRWPQAAVGLFVIGAIVSWYLALPGPQGYWSQRMELAREIRRLVPESEAVGAFWPGLFAQFTERRVVPMDGIIGSEPYFQSYVKRNAQLRYLEERGIRYVALYLDDPPDRLMAGPRLRPSAWKQLGQLRVWEAREHVAETVSARPLSDRGNGWYLLRFDWGTPTEGGQSLEGIRSLDDRGDASPD